MDRNKRGLGRYAAFALAILLTACGGNNDASVSGGTAAPNPGSSPASAAAPTVSATALDTFGGGPALTFSSADSNTTWTLTGAGSLSATRGASVSYIAPSTIPADTQVTVAATDGGASTTETVTLHAPKLNPSASAVTWFVGDAPVTLNVSPQFTNATPTWAVTGGGALDSAQGDTVHFSPPAVTVDTTVTVSASAAGHTESLNIALKPADEKTLQVNPTSVQAGNGTVALTVPSTIAHSALTWSTTLGTVAPNGDDTGATYTPPGTLATATVVAVTATDGVSAPFVATITVTPSPSLAISPSFGSVSVSGATALLSLTATVANANGSTGSTANVQWTILAGTGSVVPATGSTVSYVASGTDTTSNEPAVIQATLDGLVQSVPVTLNFQSTTTFNGPRGIAIDNVGNLFVADSGNNQIRKITPSGQVSTFAGSGAAGANDGTGVNATFNSPEGIAIDPAGNLYVADSGNNKIREITPGAVVTTLAGSGAAGSNDGVGAAATFNDPEGITFGVSGDLFVADTGNTVIRKIVPAGPLSTVSSQQTNLFLMANDITGDNAGNLYLVGSASGLVLIARVDPSGDVESFSPGGGFNRPKGIAINATGTLFVANTVGNVIDIVTLSGSVTALAGSGTGGFQDGTGSSASFNTPTGIAVDSVGNLYIADTGNNAIRVATPSGRVMTIAGTGAAGSTNGSALKRQ